MCDPVTLLIAGTAAKAGGSILAGKAEKRAAYDAASQAELEARVRAMNIRKAAAETRGAARASYAASGVTVDEGSALIADAAITRNSELDAFYTILSGNTRGASLRRQGRAAQTGGILGAFGTALSSAADISAYG